MRILHLSFLYLYQRQRTGVAMVNATPVSDRKICEVLLGERNADRKDEPRAEFALYPHLMAHPGTHRIVDCHLP